MLELSINENVLLQHDFEVMSRLRNIVDAMSEDDIMLDGLIQLVENNTTKAERESLGLFVAVELLMNHLQK